MCPHGVASGMQTHRLGVREVINELGLLNQIACHRAHNLAQIVLGVQAAGPERHILHDRLMLLSLETWKYLEILK